MEHSGVEKETVDSNLGDARLNRRLEAILALAPGSLFPRRRLIAPHESSPQGIGGRCVAEARHHI